MKTLKTIVASICFCAIFFTPTDDAPLSTTLIWFVCELGALYTLYRILKSEEKEAKSHPGQRRLT